MENETLLSEEIFYDCNLPKEIEGYKLIEVSDDIYRYKKINNQSKRNQELRLTGGSTHYYELPKNATELKHLIRHKKMSHPIGEAFCSLYRLNDNGEYKRNLEKAKYYIETELQYLEEGRD